MTLGREKTPPGLENSVFCPGLTMQHPLSTSELDIHADRLSLQRSCKTRQMREKRQKQARIMTKPNLPGMAFDENHQYNNSMITTVASNFDRPYGISRRWCLSDSTSEEEESEKQAQILTKTAGLPGMAFDEKTHSDSASTAQCIIQKQNNNNNNHPKNPTKSAQCGQNGQFGSSAQCGHPNNNTVVSSSHSLNVSHNSFSVSPYLYHFLVLVLLTFAHSADCCSSRSTPKPRPPSHSAMRPNITFQTYACPPAYAAWYCLNGATCFTVKIADSILYNCECADGYMGQRCEFKDLDGTYLPTREKLLGLGHMGIPSSEIGPVFWGALIIIIAFGGVVCMFTSCRTRTKKARIMREQTLSSQPESISHLDSVSSPSSVLPMTGLNTSASLAYGGHCTGSVHSVMEQSISYSLSHQHRSYPYIADFQGVQSRIPAKHLNNTR